MMIIPFRPSIVLILSDFVKLSAKKKIEQGSNPRIQRDRKGKKKS